MKLEAPPESIAVPRTALPGTFADELPTELPGRESVPEPSPVGDEVRP
jgi:hypothetical protein